MLDEQITRSVLYSECISFRASGEHFHVSGHDLTAFSSDCVFVELRKADKDIVLERVVVVDGKRNIDRLTAYRASENDVNTLLRMAIQVYDMLADAHPMSEIVPVPAAVGNDR